MIPALESEANEPLVERIAEPELMDDSEQAAAYAAADFADVNHGFVERFCAMFPDFREGRVLDLGCGPADIPVRLVSALPSVQIAAVDGARAMLQVARRHVGATHSGRVFLIAARVPTLPFAGASFDACISNSLFHHLNDPLACWAEIRRICRAGAPLLVMDLFRPRTRRDARTIVERAASRESAVLQRDFYNSLLAAFSLEEVRAQLGVAGLRHLSSEIVSERHWLTGGRLS